MSIHSGHRSRVKTEFLARGMEGWSDHRVLEILLFYAIPQGDVNTLAHALIERFGSLSGVFDASVDELKKVPGIGEHSATLLHLIPAIGQRYIADRSSPGTIVKDERDAVEVLRPYFYGARNEMIYILCLDGKRKVLGVRKISEGTIDSADINIRLLIEEALSLRAAGIYLAHNHVSNLAIPSGADWSGTDRLRDLMSQVGLELIDHLIFVDDDAVSLKASSPRSRRTRYDFL